MNQSFMNRGGQQRAPSYSELAEKRKYYKNASSAYVANHGLVGDLSRKYLQHNGYLKEYSPGHKLTD